MRTSPPIIDGHNDTLTKVFAEDGCGINGFLQGTSECDIDVPRSVQGGLAAGFFAIYIRARPGAPTPDLHRADDGSWTYTPPSIDHQWAAQETERLLACVDDLMATGPHAVHLVRTVPELEASLTDGRIGIILHIEGCEMISPDLCELDGLYERGLRSLGPVWSRPNCFGTGIRFGWPSTNDVGPGLTDAGKALIRACNERGILVDLSHLNYRGFMDMADVSTAPLVATHCGAHALAQSARNLTDEQLRVIAETGGLVGCNFFTGDLRGDGRFDSDMPLSRMAEHLEHFVDVMGPDHIALGSDFDGADMCDEMQDVSCLGRLIQLLRERGWSEGDLARMGHENWLRVLHSTWAG